MCPLGLGRFYLRKRCQSNPPSEPPLRGTCWGWRAVGLSGHIVPMCPDSGCGFVSVEGTNGTLFVAGARFFVSEFGLIVALNSFGIGLFMGHLCPGFGPLVFPLSGVFGWGAMLTQGSPSLAEWGPIWMVETRGNPSQRPDVTSVGAPPIHGPSRASPKFRFSPK